MQRQPAAAATQHPRLICLGHATTTAQNEWHSDSPQHLASALSTMHPATAREPQQAQMRIRQTCVLMTRQLHAQHIIRAIPNPARHTKTLLETLAGDLPLLESHCLLFTQLCWPVQDFLGATTSLQHFLQQTYQPAPLLLQRLT